MQVHYTRGMGSVAQRLKLNIALFFLVPLPENVALFIITPKQLPVANHDTQTTNYLSAKQNTPHCSWSLKKLIRDPRAVWAPFFVLAFRVIGLELTTKTRFFWFTKCNTVFSTYNGGKHFELLRTIKSSINFCLWKYLTESYSKLLLQQVSLFHF